MTTSRISRVITVAASVFFAAVALALWAAPGRAAQRLGLEALNATGTAAVRSDLGGLFAGMALLCAAAAWTGHRAWNLAAASVVAAIVMGRTIGWIVTGSLGDDMAAMVVEVGILAALLRSCRRTPEAARATSHRRWQTATVVAALLIVPALGVAAMSPALQQRIFDTAARQRAATVNTAPLEDDALRVAVCGSSAPLPSALRAKACVAVFAGGKFYVVDVGPESVENLVLWGIPLSSIGGVLLTHFHSDHIGDLGELNLQTWAGGRPAPLVVHGGPGVDRVVDGFNRAYQLDQGYRTEHHTARVMPPATWPMVPHVVDLVGSDTFAKDRTGVVLDDGALRITAIEVDHSPIAPAYAYRFDYKGRSVLVTGDLKFHPALTKSAMGADVMVSEAIAVQMTRALGAGAKAAGRSNTAAIMHDIEDYHITPDQAARIANEAGVGLLVFYHLLPSPDGMLARNVFARGIQDARRGDWTIADDGSLYTLPLGSTEIRTGHVVND